MHRTSNIPYYTYMLRFTRDNTNKLVFLTNDLDVNFIPLEQI